MKQTQTKIFNFSDVGLDFCPGSKSLFPDRFKRILALGYNEQIVSNVDVFGNKIVLTYGMSHGYVANRVIKIHSGILSTINNGEFVIDSVTSNTITISVDEAPSEISPAFSTKIAPLGWELVYESHNTFIHVYKMKHIDDTERFVRLCFQSNPTHRNAIAICVGKTFNHETGFITDPKALQETAEVLSPSAPNLARWDGYVASNAHNDWSYTQGYATYGRGFIVGSLYHFALACCWGNATPIDFYGIFPTVCHGYDQLAYPVVFATKRGNASEYGEYEYGNFYSSIGGGFAFVGNIAVTIKSTHLSSGIGISDGDAAAVTSVLPSSIDNFNTTTAEPIALYAKGSSQHLGYCYGIYRCMYADDTIAPTVSRTNLPLLTTDVDFNNTVLIANSGSTSAKDRQIYFALPLEEVKIGN